MDWSTLQVVDCACWQVEHRVREAFHIYKRQPKINRDSGLQRSAVWNAVLWELALQTCSSEFVLNSWHPTFFITFFLSVSLSLSLYLPISLSLSLSLNRDVWVWAIVLKEEKKKKGKKREKEKNYFSFNYLFFFWFCMAALLACMRIRMGTHG